MWAARARRSLETPTMPVVNARVVKAVGSVDEQLIDQQQRLVEADDELLGGVSGARNAAATCSVRPAAAANRMRLAVAGSSSPVVHSRASTWTPYWTDGRTRCGGDAAALSLRNALCMQAAYHP